MSTTVRDELGNDYYDLIADETVSTASEPDDTDIATVVEIQTKEAPKRGKSPADDAPPEEHPAGTKAVDRPVNSWVAQWSPDDLMPHTFTDLGNADLFAKVYSPYVQYLEGSKRWAVWSDYRWTWSTGGAVTELSKDLIWRMPDECGVEDSKGADLMEKHRKSSLSGDKINGTAKLAASDPAIRADLTAFDRDIWSLCTPGGDVDLTTGRLLAPSPERMHTKATPYAPDFELEAPMWDRFLRETFGGDPDLIGYMQRLVGYSLTGYVGRHILPILYGSGGNGKGVLVNVLQGLLGPYFGGTPEGFLTGSGGQKHETEIARLHGLRLAVASETESGNVFDEKRVKKLTGGDTLTGRYTYGDFFDFEPTHKLWLMTNSKPDVRNGGRSMWRRIRLIPFNHTPKQEIDNLEGLLLRSEAPGILAWAIRGLQDALTWDNGQPRMDLGDPAVVLEATDEYRMSTNAVLEFLMVNYQETGNLDDAVLLSELTEQWNRWKFTHATGKTLSNQQLSAEIQGEWPSVQTKRKTNGTYLLGIKPTERADSA